MVYALSLRGPPPGGINTEHRGPSHITFLAVAEICGFAEPPFPQGRLKTLNHRAMLNIPQSQQTYFGAHFILGEKIFFSLSFSLNI